jgi:tetrahydromethanopterin S-methyltransferase subunit A
MVKNKLKFFRQKKDIKEIVIAKFDPIKDWHQDKKGYFLIRLNRKKEEIEVGFSTNKHVITKKIHGKNATELYHTILSKNLVSRKDHAAYLGKELYKAELALKYNLKYEQDSDLKLK